MSEAMRRSEEIAVTILAKLFQNGLTPVDIDADRIALECSDGTETDEELHAKMVAEVPGVVQYLDCENLIRIAGGTSSYFGNEPSQYRGVSLTERGLRVLNALPSSMDENTDRRPLGDRLIDAVEGGKYAMAAQLFREVLRRRV